MVVSVTRKISFSTRGFTKTLSYAIVVLLLLSQFITILVLRSENASLKRENSQLSLNLTMLSARERSLSDLVNDLLEANKKLSEENTVLRSKLDELLSIDPYMEIARLNDSLSDLRFKYDILYESYLEVLWANRNLSRVIEDFTGKVILPSNLTLVDLGTLYRLLKFNYSEEMREYVYRITEGWNGSEEDFTVDLYKIAVTWRRDFKYDDNCRPCTDLLVVNPVLESSRTPRGDRYTRSAYFELKNSTFCGAIAEVIFKYKCGICYHFSLVLLSLYYAYFDIAGRYLPSALLVISIGETRSLHTAVIVKLTSDLVAIIDWEPVTSINGRVVFLPVREAKRAHEYYWKISVEYILATWRSRGEPHITRYFQSDEDFYNWVISEFN
jgi:hypothetical protein